MKILKLDKKNGIAVLVPISRDDLWVLSQVINAGALVSSKTTRKVKINDKKVEKKTYFMMIETEKVAFDGEILRVSGKVKSEHDDIPKESHHSITLDVHDQVKIQQKWFNYQYDKINSATKDKSNILLVALDRELGYIAKLKDNSYEIVVKIEGNVQKKSDQGLIAGFGSFYSELAIKLGELVERFKADKVIVASPAFFKDDFMKVVKDDSLKKIVIPATCSSVNETCFNEIIKRDEVKKALDEERLREEMNYVERLFTEISKDKDFSYGLEDVRGEINKGSVEILLITTNLINEFREQERFDELEKMMTLTESMKGKVVVIDSQNDAGKKLDGISGIGAILRFKS
jgi:mRNA surveillance protein pelota